MSSECQQGGRVQSSISTRAVFPRLDCVPQLGYNEDVSKGRTTKWHRATKIIGRDRFKELVYAQAFREHRHFYAFLYGEQMCVFRSRRRRDRFVHLFCEDGIERARALDCRKARRIMVETAWELHEGFRTKWGPKSRALRLAPTCKLCRIYAHRYPDRVSTRH